jgi:hypothetical protein
MDEIFDIPKSYQPVNFRFNNTALYFTFNLFNYKKKMKKSICFLFFQIYFLRLVRDWALVDFPGRFGFFPLLPGPPPPAPLALPRPLGTEL